MTEIATFEEYVSAAKLTMQLEEQARQLRQQMQDYLGYPNSIEVVAAHQVEAGQFVYLDPEGKARRVEKAT